MNRTVRFLTLSSGLALSLVCWLGCADEEPLRELKDGCALTSECKDPLVCAFKKCHVECKSSKDCPANARCVEAAKPYFVCQLEEDALCVRNSDCAGDQVCSRDGQCRDQCASTRDCLPDQTCVDSVCADARELDAQGALPVANGTTAPEGVACVRASDCPGDLVCKNGVCTAECVEDKDCYSSWSCRPITEGGAGRCIPPAGGGL